MFYINPQKNRAVKNNKKNTINVLGYYGLIQIEFKCCFLDL